MKEKVWDRRGHPQVMYIAADETSPTFWTLAAPSLLASQLAYRYTKPKSQAVDIQYPCRVMGWYASNAQQEYAFEL